MHLDPATIIRQALGLVAQSISPIIGQGEVNIVYDIGTADGHFIVRCNHSQNGLKNYRKENWCIAQATKAGVAGPDILAVGGEDGAAFMIQRKIRGLAGNHYKGDQGFLWREMGRAARLINFIPLKGYGGDMEESADGIFKQTWTQAVDEELRRIFESSILSDLSVLTPYERDKARDILNQMRYWQFQPHLVHGNLAPKNIVVDPENIVHVIDYENAASTRAPHGEFMDLCAWDAKPWQIEAFCDGYGMDKTDYNAVRADISLMALSRVLDAIRWAYETSHPKLADYIAHGRQKYQEILGNAPCVPYLAKLTLC